MMATILVTDRNKRSDSKRFLIFDTVAWRQPGFAAPPMPSMLSREPSIAFSLPPYPLSREPSMTSTTSNNNNNGNQTPTQSTRAVTILEPLNESTKSLLTVGKEEEANGAGGGGGFGSYRESISSPMSSPVSSMKKQPSSSSSTRSGLLTPDGSKRGFIAKGAAPLRVGRDDSYQSYPLTTLFTHVTASLIHPIPTPSSLHHTFSIQHLSFPCTLQSFSRAL